MELSSIKQGPRVAVLMLSWLRFELLLDSLRQIPSTCSSPLHLILRVQGSERLDETSRNMVRKAAENFYSTDIYFTRDNVGTAAARLDLIHRGAAQGYEYLMFTDDDIYFDPGGIDHQIQVLDAYPEVGSVSLRPRGIRKVQVVSEGDVLLTSYNNVESSLCEVYLVGSASLMFRSKFYTEHLIAPDSAYYIGTWDWDFVLQIRQLGYKVTVITSRSIINRRGGSHEYRRKRRNSKYVKENRQLFIRKWGFDPLIGRKASAEFVKPVSISDKLNTNLIKQDYKNSNMPEAIINNNRSKIINEVEEQNAYRSKNEQLVKSPLRPRISGNDWRSRIARQRIMEQANA